MLLYSVGLYFIYLCDAVNRSVGKYEQLIFAQNSPIIVYYKHFHTWPNRHTTKYNCGLSPEACISLLNEKSWIIHGIWPYKTGYSPSYCMRNYTSATMNSTFKSLLAEKWPSFIANKREASLWEVQWMKHGSCVVDIEQMRTIPKYFEKTTELLEQYNVGRILRSSNIIPGHNYTFDKILESIQNRTRTKSLVKCFIRQSSGQNQYLAEVRICFNKMLHLTDCSRFGISGCDKGKMVTYAKIHNG